MSILMSEEQKILFDQGRLLPLMEDFYTVQGEGFNTGAAAYFIRLGGCDMGCWWCDVKESWDANLHPLTLADSIIERVMQYPARAVVVTGGEPVLYDLGYLCRELKQRGVETYLETAGVRKLTGEWDWICLSPKKGSLPLLEYFQLANELKVIIHQESDLRWAELNAEKAHPGCHFYLQPEWSKYDIILPSIVDYVKTHPAWKISLQTHKFMNIP
jgi:organic radical activating enzyme